MSRMTGKVAIVTGAAGGIGSATVRRFVEEGARVLAVDLSEPGLKQFDGEDAVVSRVADTSDPDQIEAYTQAAVDQFGGLDAVALNVAIAGELVPIEQLLVESFDSVYRVNLRGTWLGTKAAIPRLRARGGGAITLTTSIQGLAAIPGTSAYTVTKHALHGMVRGAALELAREGIRVNAGAPGFVETQMLTGMFDDMSDDPDAARAGLASMRTARRRRRSAGVGGAGSC